MTNYVNKIIYLSLVFFMSCTNRIDNKSDSTLKNVQKYLNEFFVSSNEEEQKLLLNKCYEELYKNEDFINNGLTLNNYRLVETTLLYMKKYNELEELLLKTPSVPDEYNNSILLNFVRYLKYYKKNKSLSENYMKDNIILIRKQIDKIPLDSILYSDYFIMKTHLNGKDKTINEIDSMQKVNKNFSDNFYKYVLKQGIEEMEDSFPKP